MISVTSAQSATLSPLPDKADIAVYGKEIDDRSKVSIAYAIDNSLSHVKMSYNPDELTVEIDGVSLECEELTGWLGERVESKVLIDATSLDVPELALLLNGLKSVSRSNPGIQITVLYIEPEKYVSFPSAAICQEEFQLSEQILGFECSGIPTITKPLLTDSPRKFVFFLGFEGGRLLSAFEAFDISSDESEVVFGVPAFKLGWEAKSFKRNMHVLKEVSLEGRFIYCGATSVNSALTELRRKCELKPNCTINLVPIGSKPHSLAAIILFVERPSQVSLLFDLPSRKVGHSEGVGKIHLYRLVM